MFSIAGSLFFSVSNVIGFLIGGWIYGKYGVYGKYGGPFLFMLVAVVTGIWSILIAIYYFGCKFWKR